MTIIFDDLASIRPEIDNPALTIGNFDGVHRGHLVLFEKVKDLAESIGGHSSVMTFDPHPIKIMKPGNNPPLITPTPQKLKLIEHAGIDVIYCIPFTREFASISAEAFVRDILVKKIGIRELVVGHDYSFGRKREGDIDLLREMGEKLGFNVHITDPVMIGDTLVSSTSIRAFVKEGNLPEAKRLLGRDYQICGTVIRGKNRGGRLLGFPTANLEPMDELCPAPGVYAVEVILDRTRHKGLTNIGHNPTFGRQPLSVETHILDFSGELLGRKIRIDFIERLRDEAVFDTVEALAAQIDRDIRRTRKLFETREKSSKSKTARHL